MSERLSDERLTEIAKAVPAAWIGSPHSPPRWPTIDELVEARKELAELRQRFEDQRQAMARLSAPGIKRAPWFYAPCSNCGALEGMGLVTPRVDGRLSVGHTSVWCCRCEHHGPPVPNSADVEASDRAAAMSWNAEFTARLAELRKDRDRLDFWLVLHRDKTGEPITRTDLDAMLEGK